jgi:hypothetical protein
MRFSSFAWSVEKRSCTGSSNFSDRVAKWFRNIPERKPINLNNISCFTPENGGGSKSTMGSGSKRT